MKHQRNFDIRLQHAKSALDGGQQFVLVAVRRDLHRGMPRHVGDQNQLVIHHPCAVQRPLVDVIGKCIHRQIPTPLALIAALTIELGCQLGNARLQRSNSLISILTLFHRRARPMSYYKNDFTQQLAFCSLVILINNLINLSGNVSSSGVNQQTPASLARDPAGSTFQYSCSTIFDPNS